MATFPKAPKRRMHGSSPGSPHAVYDDRPWIAPLEALIRDIRDAGRPLVGICFGHQIVARAFGGRVEKFHGGWGRLAGVSMTSRGWSLR
jgi:GMP synthase-like glutamine amidotransferase